MNKFLDAISDKLLPLANKLASNRYFSILRDAFMLAFPLTMFGSIVVVISNLPFLNDGTKALLSSLFGNAQNATMSIMTVFVTWGLVTTYLNHMMKMVFLAEQLHLQVSFF